MLFEIWDGPAFSSLECASVSQRDDELRARVEPDATLLASFYAASDFQAFQKSYDWHGWGTWKPDPDWEEHLFTDEEAEEQAAYLRNRQLAPGWRVDEAERR